MGRERRGFVGQSVLFFSFLGGSTVCLVQEVKVKGVAGGTALKTLTNNGKVLPTSSTNRKLFRHERSLI